jgi:hypothetical protein
MKKKVPTVYHFWPPDFVHPLIKGVAKVATHVGGESPELTEDVSLSIDSDKIAVHFERLSNDDEYVRVLRELQKNDLQLPPRAVDLSMDVTLKALSDDRGGDNSLEACSKQAGEIFAQLDEARRKLPEWRKSKLTRTRQGVDDQCEVKCLLSYFLYLPGPTTVTRPTGPTDASHWSH